MRLRIFIKYALYALTFLVVFTFQSAFARMLTVLGVRPDFMPVLVACAAVFEGMLPAAFLGLWAGLLCDTVSVSGLFFSLFYYFAAAGASCLCRRRFYPRPAVALGVLAALVLLSQVFLYLFYYLPFYHAPAVRLLRILLVEGGCCLLAFFPAFMLCRKLHALAPQASGIKAASIERATAPCRIIRLEACRRNAQRRSYGTQK